MPTIEFWVARDIGVRVRKTPLDFEWLEWILMLWFSKNLCLCLHPMTVFFRAGIVLDYVAKAL